MPPPPSSQTSDTPPPKKATKTRKVKREKPNTYSIRENFCATDDNEYVVKTPDDVKDLQNFRLFCNEERTRAVVFDFNKFQTKEGKDVKTPTLFFVNHWDEKKENMKHPNSDNGKKKGFIYKKDCNEHELDIFYMIVSVLFCVFYRIEGDCSEIPSAGSPDHRRSFESDKIDESKNIRQSQGQTGFRC